MGAIDIKSAGKIYPNGTRALEDVSITINDGEFVVLVGPSGCGKTTLQSILMGFINPDEGNIYCENKHCIASRRSGISFSCYCSCCVLA